MRQLLRKIFRNLPYVKPIILERDQLRIVRDLYEKGVPPGHYYSPIPSIEEIRRKEQVVFDDRPNAIPGVDLNEAGQVELLNRFKEYYRELPFEARKKEGLRYFFENSHFSYGDGIVLYSMIRHVRPKKIIEIGSGYSSCTILDVNELFFDNKISYAIIDPYPELLPSLIDGTDKDRIEIIPKKLQDVDIAPFSSLSSHDILFIDSSHVSKIDSDVNHVFFRILPHIKRGVYIHFHDIVYPFEYPKEWIYQEIAWNEAYLLRAFLQYNERFKIEFFNSYLNVFHEEELRDALPLCMKNTGGSIWIKKT